MRSRTVRKRTRRSENGSVSPGRTHGVATRTTRTAPSCATQNAHGRGSRPHGALGETLRGPFGGKDHRDPVAPGTSFKGLYQHRPAVRHLRLHEAYFVGATRDEVEVVGRIRVRVYSKPQSSQVVRRRRDDLSLGDPGPWRPRRRAHGPLLKNQRSSRVRGIPRTIGRPWGQENAASGSAWRAASTRENSSTSTASPPRRAA